MAPTRECSVRPRRMPTPRPLRRDVRMIDTISMRPLIPGRTAACFAAEEELSRHVAAVGT
jgi:hypothetical protein